MDTNSIKEPVGIIFMLKVNFVDFWDNFKKDDNYFYNLLSTKYEVMIDEEDPDLLFFSVDYAKKRERNKYLNHRCKKIFFTGENVRPNFDQESVEYPRYSIGKADIAFTFDYSDDKRNYRFPLWAFFTNWFYRDYEEDRDPAYLIPVEDVLKGLNPINNRSDKWKDNFCNFLFSNASGERMNIFDTLSQYKTIHAPGRLKNNTNSIGGRGDQIEKIIYIQRFKFTVAAENSKHDGYTTEKMIHPMSVGSIPIYWGSDRVTEEFNEKAFVDANKLHGQDLIDEVQRIDNDDDAYIQMINEPVFPNNKIPDYVVPESVLEFIERSIL